MKKMIVTESAFVSVALALLCPALALASSLDSPAAPSDSASAMYSTDAVYGRLQSGAAGAKRAAGFSEPGAGPANGSRKTLDEVMAVAPAADNVNGAAPADVANGKKYWGLRTDGGWGLQTGTAAGGASYPAPVPRSGQTLCYDAGGTVIGCAGTGQDGDKVKGVALPTPRFTANGNGTVTDNKTGLVWLANANCLETVGGIAKAGGTLSWAEALAWSNNLASGKCGLTDGSVAGNWRLPNREELASLVNAQYANPALSNTAGTAQWTAGNPFSGVLSTYYWTSTTYASSTTSGWGVVFSNGDVSNGIKTNPGYVWPVRDGQ